VGRQVYVKASAIVLAVAGLMWSFKAAVIMVTGDQPALTFELGQLLFPIGAVGLYLSIEKSHPMRNFGLALAILGIVGSVLALLYLLLPGAEISTSEDFVFPYSVFVLAGNIGGFLAFIVMGIAIYRTRSDLHNWRTVPLVLALVPLLLIATGAIHLEMPILLIGLTWLLIAYFVWWVAGTSG